MAKLSPNDAPSEWPSVERMQPPLPRPTTTTSPPAAPAAPQAPAPRLAPPAAGRALSPRVLLLAFLLIPLNCYWIIQMERVRQGPYVTSISLFANVVFILLLFVAINVPLRRWRPGWALRRGELLLLYVMLSISSGICGMDLIQVLMQ